MNDYNIKSVSIINTIRTLLKSDIFRNKEVLLLLVFYCVIRFVDGFLDKIFSSTNYIWSYYIITIFFSLIFSAYLLLTALDKYNVLSKDRLLRSIILPIYQVKTLLTFIISIIPILLISGIIFSVIYVAITVGLKIELTESNTLVVTLVYAAVMLIFILPKSFCTYLVVIHNINGFNSIRLSKEIFEKNKLSSVIFFVGLIFLPAVIFMVIESKYKNLSSYYIAHVLTSIVIFINHFIVANFLKEAVTYKEVESENTGLV